MLSAPSSPPPARASTWKYVHVFIATLLAATGRAQSPEPLPRSSSDLAPPNPSERLPVFFPPVAPPLGRPATRGVTPGSQRPAPPELAPYVSEFFYPMLGTRLVTKTLHEKQRTRLEAYRVAKLTLQNELRTELERLRSLEPPARTEALAAFSRRQTPKIVELEKTAEQLRRDLLNGEQNWNAHRQWFLSHKPDRGYSPFEIAQVMRAYAFYHNALLPAQRRLLREISIELVFAGENTAAATAAQPYLFFPPEPARVLLPNDLPAEVAAKFARYQTEKSALKKELYDAVVASDGNVLGFLRGTPLKGLPDRQAARLDALEALAEEIRRGIKDAPSPRVERSPLTVALDARIETLISNYLTAQKEAAARIDAILARARDLPMQASYRFEADGLKFLVVPLARARNSSGLGATSARIAAVRDEISRVADDYGRRAAELLNERESIRQEIVQTLGTKKAEDTDRAFLAAMRAAIQRETESAFSDYRAAVFEPGLSPEQRRLLFDSAVERMELPLPRGELQPTVRADTW